MRITYPSAIHNAYNPVLVIQEDEYGDVEYAQVRVHCNESTYTLKKKMYGGRCVTDISSVLKEIFRERLIEIEDNIYEDRLLAIPYRLEVYGEFTEYLALNAVSQLGESPNKTALRGTMLTNRQTLKRYDGYPLSVAVLGEQGNTQITILGESKSIASKHFVININADGTIVFGEEMRNIILEDINAQAILTSQGFEIVLGEQQGSGQGISIVSTCTPNAPFYVRWINAQGGYDYQMFERTQEVSESVKVKDLTKPVVTDTETATTTMVAISITNSKTIKVGASNLSNEEFDVVKDVINSNYIQYYNPNLNKWFRTHIEKADVKTTIGETMQGLELEFYLDHLTAF